jgi:hypothetical protein
LYHPCQSTCRLHMLCTIPSALPRLVYKQTQPTTHLLYNILKLGCIILYCILISYIYPSNRLAFRYQDDAERQYRHCHRPEGKSPFSESGGFVTVLPNTFQPNRRLVEVQCIAGGELVLAIASSAWSLLSPMSPLLTESTDSCPHRRALRISRPIPHLRAIMLLSSSLLT